MKIKTYKIAALRYLPTPDLWALRFSNVVLTLTSSTSGLDCFSPAVRSAFIYIITDQICFLLLINKIYLNYLPAHQFLYKDQQIPCNLQSL